MLATLLAIGWEPELRGILTVILGAATWMGQAGSDGDPGLGFRLPI